MIDRKLFNKSFVSAAFGTMLEYYDVVLFIIFLPILSPIFFQADSTYQSLVKGYFVLFISMLARPLGALVFGHIGDVYGRRKALLGSMYGIAFATLIIGLIPSYTMIGIWSVVIITCTKAVQLFCFGGELNGAGIYVVEHAQNKREAFMGSLLAATALAGSVFASLLGVILTLSFMPTWSWRIAFILGGMMGMVGIIFRRNLLESPNFQCADLNFQGLRHLVTHYHAELLAGIFIGGLATAPVTTVLAFINPVLMTKDYLTHHQFMLLQMFLMILAMIVLVLVGIIADKKSPGKVMQVGCWFLIMLSYPLLLLVDSGNWSGIVVGLILLVIGNEIFLGPVNAYLKNLFVMQFRYRGSSLSFCLGVALLGGLTPIVEHYLYQTTGRFSSISIWLIFIALGTTVSLSYVHRKRTDYVGDVVAITAGAREL